ncbi:hypothetical protein ACA578_14735 [Lactiplantibacillus plantarum]|uniref:hypothetical protein n=1 Tax=Lactiplantibacillus plantarum TaxID=1590 RepID=UPI003C1F45D4
MTNNKQLKLNFIFVIFAQLVTLIVSCMTNLLLPKYISQISYSYWQFFIFYAGYIPCLALGLNDGIYLRLGGKTVNELNTTALKSQYLFGQFFQMILVFIISCITFFVFGISTKTFVFLLVFLYFISYTSYNFLSNVFQAINKINIFATATIIFQFTYFIFQLLFIVKKENTIFYLIVYYIIANFISVLYMLKKIKPIFRRGHVNFQTGKLESIISMKTGISLMFANICSMLVLGVGRQIIELRWGILAFGKISFALSLINFALMFIIQISSVLFPTLRRLDFDQLRKVYIDLMNKLFIFLPIIFLAYIPGKLILEAWIPKYTESIGYLGILLPICFFDCRMNLVNTTIFKVLNKQVLLLEVNIVTIIVSVFVGLVGAYLVNDVNFVIYTLVFSVAFRCIISDCIISRWMRIGINKYIIFDIILCILFIVIVNLKHYVFVIAILLGCIILRYVTIKFYGEKDNYEKN